MILHNGHIYKRVDNDEDIDFTEAQITITGYDGRGLTKKFKNLNYLLLDYFDSATFNHFCTFDNLETIDLGPNTFKKCFAMTKFPPNLKNLRMPHLCSGSHNFKNVKLPESLKYLDLNHCGNHLNDLILPPNLKCLNIDHLNKDTDLSTLELPDTLKILVIRGNYNNTSIFNNKLPSSLKTLAILCLFFNQDISNVQFPHSLKNFYITAYSYGKNNHPLKNINLKNIKHIYICSSASKYHHELLPKEWITDYTFTGTSHEKLTESDCLGKYSGIFDSKTVGNDSYIYYYK